MTRGSRPQSRELLFIWTGCAAGATVRARAALRQTLGAWVGSSEIVDDVILAVSELVANAAEHATGPYELWLEQSSAAVVCEVHDHDLRIPRFSGNSGTALFAVGPQDRGGGVDALSALLSERGRGLQIVDYLSGGRWGFRLTGDGKKVAWVAFSATAKGDP